MDGDVKASGHPSRKPPQRLFIAKYIGVPFLDRGRDTDGWDCWGCVAFVAKAEAGIDLPSFAERYETHEDWDHVAATIRGELGPWRLAEAGAAIGNLYPDWGSTPTPTLPHQGGGSRPGDVALLRVRNRPIHVGLVVEPGAMLHVEQGRETIFERYDGLRWKNRLIGVFRYCPAPSPAVAPEVQ